MAQQRMMLRFARWHIWLGWVVGAPILMWTLTGLFMVARPIEEVRGEHLRAPPNAVVKGAYALPDVGEPIVGAELVQQPIGPVWLVSTAEGARYRYFAPDGSLVPPVIESEAREIADATYSGDGTLEAVVYIPADAPPSDLRAGVNAWQARFSDGTNVYLDAATGEVLAVRTGWWRTYDLMWALHIMNLENRDNPHHPLIIVSAVLASIGALLGCILLFRRRKARRRQ
jgi:uncharacterized iron-regulated membrane protein